MAGGVPSRSDLPPPTLVTPRGALRRSLALWGWGHVATGSRRGLALVPLELASLALLGWFGPLLATGTWSIVLFLGGALFLATWVGVAVGAYRRAVRRRIAFDLPGADGGAIELLWLAPVVIALASGFWLLPSMRASPEAVLADYVAAWRGGAPADVEAARVGFVTPLSGPLLAGAWERQTARLRNAVIQAAAQAGAASGIEPDQPLGSVRFVVRGDAAGRRVGVEIVRREAVRDTYFGVLPTTSTRFVPVADLGTIELVLVRSEPLWGGGPAPDEWRIGSVDLLGESLGPQASGASGSSMTTGSPNRLNSMTELPVSSGSPPATESASKAMVIRRGVPSASISSVSAVTEPLIPASRIEPVWYSPSSVARNR